MMTATVPTTTNRRFFIILILISSVLLGLSLWFGQRLIQDPINTVLFAPTRGCQLPQQQCSAIDGTRTIQLTVESDTLSSHQPIPVRVVLGGYNPSQVSIRLQGAEMYMGENSTPLQHQDDGSYRADIQLPVCTTGTMLWRAQVIIEQAGTSTGSWFDFEAS